MLSRLTFSYKFLSKPYQRSIISFTKILLPNTFYKYLPVQCRFQQTSATIPISEQKIAELLDQIRLMKATATARFIETVDLVLNLNYDYKRTEHRLRGTVVLPHGNGKTVRVAVFATGEKAEQAKKAGADFVGGEDLVQKIKDGFVAFERCFAVPELMPIVSKIARVLGPRGLMPNPKQGTVTQNLTEVIETAKRGQVTFKTDKTGNVHVALAKVNFDDNKIMENLMVVVKAIIKAKPIEVKATGGYIKKICISSTMGPSFQLDHKYLENPTKFQKKTINSGEEKKKYLLYKRCTFIYFVLTKITMVTKSLTCSFHSFHY